MKPKDYFFGNLSLTVEVCLQAPKDSGSDNVNRLNAALQETDSVPDKQDVAPENKAAAQERRTIIDQLNAALDTPESATEKKDATAPEKRVTAQERRDILAKLNAALQKADSVLEKIENPDAALERDRHAEKEKVSVRPSLFSKKHNSCLRVRA